MITPQELKQEMLHKAHEYYMEVESLTNTSKWLADEFDINFNRFKLSKQFHRNGLYVAPPNGKPELDYYQENDFLDEWNEFAADMVELAWRDIIEYLRGEGSKMDYMSACWFVSSPLYNAFLTRLKNNVFGGGVDENTLPEGVDREDIVIGRNLYETRMNYWVLNDNGN